MTARPHPLAARPATRAAAMARLIDGVRADLTRYAELQGLLEAQFQAALQHRALPLTELTERVTELLDSLDLQRRERSALVAQLLGQGVAPSMPAVLALLNPAARHTLADWWQTLEGLVRECKALNARNARLMADQRDVMERIMGTVGLGTAQGSSHGHQGAAYGPA